MLNKLLSVSGALNASVSGMFGASEEHRRFMANGYRCPKCDARLMSALGYMTCVFHDAEGNKLSLIAGGAVRATSAECPKCGYRWPTRGAQVSPPAAEPETTEIVETEREEEFIGEDRRVIDNLRSSSQPTRTFSFSKEWSKTCQVELERAKTKAGELNLGAKDVAALRLSTEEKLRQAYSVTQGTRETTSEDVSVQVPARCKLTVIVRWKRIWQHGMLVVTQGSDTVHIPFRAAVGATFDQEQIEEKAEAADGSGT